VADDHAMFRQGICALLKSHDDIEIIGEASDGKEAVEKAGQLTPHVVLMDIGMPGMGGLAAAEAIRKTYPQVGVLILTIHDREDYFFRALRAGASGYILKGAELEELVEAVQAVARGETYIFPSLMPKLVGDYLHRVQSGETEPDELKRLTPREQEVLRLIGEGRTTNEIANALTLSPHTVRRHRDNIMQKLNLHSKAELIRFAVRKGLLDELE